MFNITKGISSLYISGKKRKRSEKPDVDISTKFQDLKDKFKDLASLYDELEDQLADVHFMNLSDIKYYKRRPDRQKYNKHNNIPNSHKNFNYNYNNLNDYYYSLYKKLTNKKQKITNDNSKKGEEYKKLYNIDNEISLNFSNTKLNKLVLNSNKTTNNDNNNNNIKNNTISNNDTNNLINNTSIGIVKSNRLKKNRYSRYQNSSTKQNNFIPSGIKIPKKFNSNEDENKNSSDSDNNKKKPLPSLPLKTKTLLLHDNNFSKSTNSFFINNSKSSLVSSNSDTIKDNMDINNNKRKFNSLSIPYLNSNTPSIPLDNISRSTFFEDLNDFVEKGNEDNGNGNAEIAVHSTYTKLNTIPYNSFQTQNDLLNIMNESKLKAINYLKLYSSRSIRNSSSDFIFESSSDSVKDKKDCVEWNKNLNVNDYNNNNNNYYQINPPDSDEESDPFENISDLTISSDEREQHLSINNISENRTKQPLHHHHISHREEKRVKRPRKNSNASETSNVTSASTVTTETTTTTTSGIANDNDHYQDDITYSELLNNPMKKHEIYQMEKKS